MLNVTDAILGYRILGYSIATWFQALVAIAIGFLVASILRRFVRRALAGRAPEYVISSIEKAVYYTVLLVAFVTAVGFFGFTLTGLLLAGGIAGIVIGFAAQTVISNLLSGVFLYIDRPIKIGDPIQIPDIGVSGRVVDISIISTRIRTWDGVYVRVPNSKVFESVIKNYTTNVARRVSLLVGISYSSDIEKAREVIMKVLDEHPLVLAEPEPQVFVEELGDSSVNLRVFAWAPADRWVTVRRELLERIKIALDEAGIEIPFPQRVVWFANELRISKGELQQS